MKLGILSQDVRLYSTSRLFKTAKERGHTTEVVSYLRCYMNIAKAKPRIFFQGREVNFDVVIPRIAATWTFYGAAVVRQFELMGSLSANSSASISRSRDKLRALQLIGNSGVEMPITGYVHLSRDIESVLRTVGTPPYVTIMFSPSAVISVFTRAFSFIIEARVSSFISFAFFNISS